MRLSAVSLAHNLANAKFIHALCLTKSIIRALATCAKIKQKNDHHRNIGLSSASRPDIGESTDNRYLSFFWELSTSALCYNAGMNKKTLIRVSVILLVFAGLIFVFQDKLIFFPAAWPEGFKLPEKIGITTISSVKIPVNEEVTLDAVFASPGLEVSKRPQVILYNHGNASNLLHRIERVTKLCEMGFPVLVYDYRGFGRSTGKPDVNGAIADGKAALAFLQATFNYQPAEIIIYGESLGTGVAAELVKQTPASFSALVLESGFASLSAQANRRFPLIGGLILKRDLPTIDFIKSFQGKLLIIHSKNDEIIPYSDSEKLFAASPSKQKQMLTLEGVGHNDPVWNKPEYRPTWEALFNN